MRTTNFEDIRDEFIARAHDAIWCAAATVSTADRPRSRVLHPIWVGQTGWVATFRNSHKGKHLAHNPYMSLTYMKEVFKPVYVECKAEWVDDLEGRQYGLDLFNNTPPPVGYPMNVPVTDPDYGLLKLVPWRIELAEWGSESKIWTAQ